MVQKRQDGTEVINMQKEIKIMGYECCRCMHTWKPKKYKTEEPKVCPHCKSAYWNTKRSK